MDYPFWITSQDLGSFSQDYSFDLNPLDLGFSVGPSFTVSLINGSLPTGLVWSVGTNSVTINGVVVPSTTTIESRFTFRITQSNGAISDRTFLLTMEPVAVNPSWDGQRTFLGYQGNTSPVSYQLSATPPPGEYLTYSLISAPTGMSIGFNTGLLTYDASSETINTTVQFTARASATSTSSDIDLSIDVVISPLAPVWVTGVGSIGSFLGNEFIEINLEATDVTGATVVYSLASSDPDFPLTLDPSGFLYGQPANPIDSQTYSFSVIASSPNGSTIRNFTITILPSESYNLLVWITPSDLGTIEDGQYIDIPILAETQRRQTIVYSVSGGVLPPHLMLERTGAKIVGFCEYHATDKVYYFDITATDGYQYITRQFKIAVNRRYGDQFFNAYIPLTGDLRDQWAADVSNVKVRIPGSITFSSIDNVIDPPYLNIVDGLVTGYSTPDELVSRISPWLHTLDLQLGVVNSAALSTSVDSVIYREIVDRQLGSNLSVYSSAVYNTNVQTDGVVYPISIQNLRSSLIGDFGFVYGGSGSGAILNPVIDWSNGSVSRIDVISPGSGYTSPPEISISGSGSGAAATAVLGMIDATIIDTGQGWQVGDLVTIPGGLANVQAEIQITGIGTNGSVASFVITNAGDYNQVTDSYDLTIYRGSASVKIRPIWGVLGVNMVSGGAGYQCGINIGTIGGELLPSWQSSYFPAIEIGTISSVTASGAANVLNTENSTMLGLPWKPNYVVFQWQGLKWFGNTTFDGEWMTFDGNTTRFSETEDPRVTLFDDDLTVFNNDYTTFDTVDPLSYDLWQVWGSTLIDQGTTSFDLYATIFDALAPRRTSVTAVRKWIKTQQRIYSGNNAVW